MSSTTTVSDQVLDHVLAEVLAEIRASLPGDPTARAERARMRLREVLDAVSAEGGGRVFRQALACAEAAVEHLGYGELPEARTLLTAARGQLALLSFVPAQGVELGRTVG